MTLRYWLAALYLPHIGPRKFMQWLKAFPHIEALFHASSDQLTGLGLTQAHIQAIQNPNWQMVEQDLIWMQQIDHHIISFADEDYPALLKEISDPPLILFLRGDRKVLTKKQMAIVGSRNATPLGLRDAESFAYSLAAMGLVITSGLARGIDGASHQGAIDANGITIGVCGTGLNHIYPARHRPLVEKIIAANGAIISEFPLATPPQAQNFPRRNRIIAGLSMGVLVVEAALKSGSLITARHALEQGREVFAIPGSIHNSCARGCHYLIREGAKLVEKIEDILEEIGALCAITSVQTSNQTAEKPTLSPQLVRVLEQIGYEITPVDVIILRSGLTASEVSSMLLTLELSGYIQSVAGGYIRMNPNKR